MAFNERGYQSYRGRVLYARILIEDHLRVTTAPDCAGRLASRVPSIHRSSRPCQCNAVQHRT